MKIAKVIIMLAIYAAFFFVLIEHIYPAAKVGYGETMGAVFTFFPFVLLVLLYKRVFQISEKILGLLIVIDPDYKP